MKRWFIFALTFSLLAAIGSLLDAAPETQPAKTMDLLLLDRDSGSPAANVKVNVSTDGPSKKLITGADGHVAIPISDNPRAYLSVEIHLDGYVDKLLQWRSAEADPIPDSYTMKLEHGTTIHGRVVDDQSAPVSGATVVIDIRDPNLPPEAHERNYVSFKSVKTTDDGTWTFNGAPAEIGELELGVWHYQYACTQTGGFYALNKVDVAQARDGTCTLMLPRGVPIEGIVVDGDDKPVKGARVIFGGDMASNKMDPQKTRDDGKFVYAAKSGEEAVLTVTCKGYAPELQTIHMTDDKQDVKFTLSPSKAMFGRVVGPDGEPVPNAWVYPDTWRGKRSLETRIHADKAGNFRWADAPLDAVKCDVDGSSAGYMRETMDLVASDDEIVVTLHKGVHITGTVVDDETGKPIDVFRVVPGIMWNQDNRVTWERQRSQEKSRSGKIDYTETWSRPAFAMRIEAAGYLPEEQKGFTVAQGDQNFDIRLKKADPIKLSIAKPDGSPTTKAKVFLVLAGQNLNISNGDANNWSCPEASVDEHGKVEFPPQIDVYTIVATSEDGYAQVEQSAVGDSNTITLQAWGKVEGTLTLDGKPTADALVAIDLQRQNMPMHMQTNPQIYHNIGMKTDAQGKFVFSHVPPGDAKISRREYVPFPGQPNMFTDRDSLTQNITITAGETTTINLGGDPDSTPAK